MLTCSWWFFFHYEKSQRQQTSVFQCEREDLNFSRSRLCLLVKIFIWTAIKQIFNHSAETSLCVYSHESGNWSMQLYIMFSPGDMFISVFIKPTYFPFCSFCDTVPCVYIVWICECIECAVNVYILRKCASIGYDWLSLYWAHFFAVSCGLSVAASLSIKHAQVLRYLLIENTSGSRDMFPTS